MEQRILVVDDDPQIVRLLRAGLEQAGYSVFVAYDGETALHMLRRERPDLRAIVLPAAICVPGESNPGDSGCEHQVFERMTPFRHKKIVRDLAQIEILFGAREISAMSASGARRCRD